MAKRPKATDLTVARMDPSDRRVIGQQVVARILELIRTGSLRAGDRLPPERELIEIFGISRPSLREALRALSMLGVVNSLHGGGAYVSDLEARTLLAPLDFYMSLTKANFADAFDSRRVIEIEIARRAAPGRRQQISRISAASSRPISPCKTIPSAFAFSTPVSMRGCQRSPATPCSSGSLTDCTISASTSRTLTGGRETNQG